MTVLVRELGEVVGVSRACTALGVPRPSYYRRRRPARWRAQKKRPPPPRALGPREHQEVIEVLHSERFVDQAPAQVVAALLQDGIYHCSARTMYRILSARGEVRERRNQLRHPRYQRPELLATGPNQVWSWDIERHEAHLNPAVMKGHRLRLVAASRKKQRAARVGGRRRRWKAALSTTEQTSTVRWSGSGKQDGKAYVRNQRPNTPQEIHQPKPDGWGLGSSAHLHRELALQATPRPIDVVGQEATAKFCGVVVAMLQGYSWAPTPSKGSSVNVGTISPVLQPASVLGGRKARRRSVPMRWGGGPVVVRDRESRLHGEGVQRDRSIFAKRGGRW